jgi:serine/threonine protein kinase
MDFNFPQKSGIGITKFLSHVSTECQDLISKLLIYNPEERYSAKQALNHTYFKDLVEHEIKMSKMSQNNFKNQNLMLSFNNNNNDSMSFIKG